MTAHRPRSRSQVRTPNYAGAELQPYPVHSGETTTIRVTFTPQASLAVGVRIEVYNTGIKADGTSENQTPQVDAYVSSSTSSVPSSSVR